MRPIYLFFIILTINYATTSPIPSEGVDLAGSTTKKDVFISRGWGAGGMPFSVLYMNPLGGKSPSGPATQQLYQHQRDTRPKALPQVRTAGNGSITPRRKQYSIIPQLFVSYGWGPLGK